MNLSQSQSQSRIVAMAMTAALVMTVLAMNLSQSQNQSRIIAVAMTVVLAMIAVLAKSLFQSHNHPNHSHNQSQRQEQKEMLLKSTLTKKTLKEGCPFQLLLVGLLLSHLELLATCGQLQQRR